MTSEILIYKNQDRNIKIDVRLQEETVWLTQDQMATLFGKARNTISEHTQNVYEEGELEQIRTSRKFRQVRTEGNNKCQVFGAKNLTLIHQISLKVM